MRVVILAQLGSSCLACCSRKTSSYTCSASEKLTKPISGRPARTHLNRPALVFAPPARQLSRPSYRATVFVTANRTGPIGHRPIGILTTRPSNGGAKSLRSPPTSAGHTRLAYKSRHKHMTQPYELLGFRAFGHAFQMDNDRDQPGAQPRLGILRAAVNKLLFISFSSRRSSCVLKFIAFETREAAERKLTWPAYGACERRRECDCEWGREREQSVKLIV